MKRSKNKYYTPKGIDLLTGYVPRERLKEVHRAPRTMPHLTAKHFRFGHWHGIDDTPVIRDDDPRLTMCGTPRCAVGNVLSAFGLPCAPEIWMDSPLEKQVERGEGPVAKFVRIFAKHLGWKEYAEEHGLENLDQPSLYDLSDLFESRDKWNTDEATETKKVAKAWDKTLTELGYTERL